jgi:prophage regulatory protein
LDDAGLTEKGVQPRSKAQRWRLIRAGQFPKPIKLGSRNCWIESEIDAWIADRIRARDNAAA